MCYKISEHVFYKIWNFVMFNATENILGKQTLYPKGISCFRRSNLHRIIPALISYYFISIDKNSESSLARVQ